MVPAHLTPADQAVFGEAETLRLQVAPEPGHKDVSGLGVRWLDAFVRIEDRPAAGEVTGPRLHPARGRADGLPAGIDRAASAGWERPRT
ncbi:MAG: hypothetical protein OXE58_05605 [Acidobacteria bacterium]|nr:hypothetical protein [Acidobacteriota bacterium]